MGGITAKVTKQAFAKFGANSWGVPTSVTKGVYFASDGGLGFKPTIVDDEAFGQTFIQESEVGDIAAESPNWTQEARYDDYSYILQALAMGSPAAVTISTSASGQTTSWLHQFDLADVIDGLGITFAIDKQQYVEELTSAKIHGFSFADGNGGILMAGYKLTGGKTTILSSTNINSTLATATFPALGNRIFTKHGTFRMNKQSAIALASGDAVKIENFKVEFNRPQDAPMVHGQDYIDEPCDQGYPTIAVDVTYPRMNTVSANSLRSGLRDATTFKADYTSLGAFINSTDQYKQLWQFPDLQLDSFEAAVTGGNQVKPKARFRARLASTSPAGMAFVRPFRLTRIMSQSLVAF